jgi:hypothetical protein
MRMETVADRQRIINERLKALGMTDYPGAS